MRQLALSILVLTAAAMGCQSSSTQQLPSIDPFAGYGHTRIAPPKTGSYGVANRNQYYNGAGQANASDQGQKLAATSVQPAAATNLVDATKPTTRQEQTARFEAPASADMTTRVASNETPIRVVERVGSVSQSNTELQGMAMVDATDSAPRLAARSGATSHQSSENQPTQFQPVQSQSAESKTHIRVLPNQDETERPLPVRGFSQPPTKRPSTLPEATPSPIRPSATIQAGRFVPLDIATNRSGHTQRSTIVAAAGN